MTSVDTESTAIVDVAAAPRETPNWVEIGTFVVAIVGVLGVTVKFLSLDRQLSLIETQLRQNQATYESEHAVQVNGTFESDAYESRDILAVSVSIENIRKRAVQIESITLTCTPLEVSKEVIEALTHGIHEDPRKTDLSILTTLGTGSQFARIPVATPSASYAYNPSEHSGGLILAGQHRAVRFDLLAKTGNVPEAFRVTVAVKVSEHDTPYIWRTWIGFGGFPSPIKNLNRFAPS
jgi:hypothetical protein